MAYNFNSVDMILLDAHTAIKPIIQPELLKETFRFLTNRAKYNKQFTLEKTIESDNGVCQPVTKRERSRNHFWKNYIAQYLYRFDYYDLQIPFIFKPKNFDLTVNLENYSFTVPRVEAFVYLTSTGWSSTVRMSLAGENISSGKLQEFTGSLGNKLDNAFPFLISGEKHKLTSVFRKMKEIVKNEIYLAPDSIGEKISIPRQHFISLAKTTSTPKFYNGNHAKKAGKHNPVMATAERAELLSILFGNAVTATDVATYEQKTLRTWFNETNFSLTNFDLGNLLFMQEEAAGSAPKVKSLRCMNSNISTCTRMNLMLLHFHSLAEKFPQTNTTLNVLLIKTRGLFRHIPSAYNNRYCDNLYQHHGNLEKYYYEDIS